MIQCPCQVRCFHSIERSPLNFLNICGAASSQTVLQAVLSTAALCHMWCCVVTNSSAGCAEHSILMSYVVLHHHRQFCRLCWAQQPYVMCCIITDSSAGCAEHSSLISYVVLCCHRHFCRLCLAQQPYFICGAASSQTVLQAVLSTAALCHVALHHHRQFCRLCWAQQPYHICGAASSQTVLQAVLSTAALCHMWCCIVTDSFAGCAEHSSLTSFVVLRCHRQFCRLCWAQQPCVMWCCVITVLQAMLSTASLSHMWCCIITDISAGCAEHSSLISYVVLCHHRQFCRLCWAHQPCLMWCCVITDSSAACAEHSSLISCGAVSSQTVLQAVLSTAALSLRTPSDHCGAQDSICRWPANDISCVFLLCTDKMDRRGSRDLKVCCGISDTFSKVTGICVTILWQG